jgi:hypothetical protein
MPAFVSAPSIGLYAAATNVSWLIVSIFAALATIVLPAATHQGEFGLVIKSLYATLAIGVLLAAGLGYDRGRHSVGTDI